MALPALLSDSVHVPLVNRDVPVVAIGGVLAIAAALLLRLRKPTAGGAGQTRESAVSSTDVTALLESLRTSLTQVFEQRLQTSEQKTTAQLAAMQSQFGTLEQTTGQQLSQFGVQIGQIQSGLAASLAQQGAVYQQRLTEQIGTATANLTAQIAASQATSASALAGVRTALESKLGTLNASQQTLDRRITALEASQAALQTSMAQTQHDAIAGYNMAAFMARWGGYSFSPNTPPNVTAEFQQNVVTRVTPGVYH